MQLKKLRLLNWKTFKGEHEFIFPQEAGLYFMTGDNQVEPRLESNGTGKSSLWDAVSWVLYGRTSANLRASDVLNWDSSDSEVAVELYYEHGHRDTYILRRSWNPISWTLAMPDGRVKALADKDDANAVLSHLGIEPDLFHQSCILPQGGRMFLDLETGEKEALFARSLNLDVWLDYSDSAAARATDAGRQLAKMRESLAECRGKLSELQTHDYAYDVLRWDKDHEDRCTVLRAAVAAAEERLNRNQREVTTCAQERAKLVARLNNTRLAMEAQRVELRAKQEDVKDGERLVHELELKMRDLEKAARSLSVEQCPECKQTITASYRMSQVNRMESQSTSVRKELGRANQALADLLSAAAKVQDEIQAMEDSTAAINQAFRDVERSAAAAETEVRQSKEYLRDNQPKLKALKAEENPFIERQLSQDQRIDELQDRAGTLSDEISRLLEVQQYGQFWAKGFKEIRLYLISESLHHLEVETNSCLVQLGLAGWQLQFDVDRENRSGKTRKGFFVGVKSPVTRHAVPWKSWSGGEAQRLRIAAQMGFANLVRSSRGVDFNLEVWDEPANWMSPQGVSDLHDSLLERALKTGRQIWVIDHHSLGYGAFKQTVTITKTQEGSSIL